MRSNIIKMQGGRMDRVYTVRDRYQGFTIVELLIVIVVIGILAAIVIVAYTGINASARDSARDSALDGLKKAIEVYYVDNGSYPVPKNAAGQDCLVGSGAGACTVSDLKSALTTGGSVSQIPDDPDQSNPSKRIIYLANSTGYSIVMRGYETKTQTCRYLGGSAGTGWWAGTPNC